MAYLSVFKKSVLLCVLLVAVGAGARAQSERSMTAGGGAANVLDTYLAPYSYTGGSVRMQFTTLRPTRLMDGAVSRGSMFDLGGAVMDNHAGNTDAYSFALRYSMAWLYSPMAAGGRAAGRGGMELGFGPEVSLSLGGVAIDRSGNNPANAHAGLTVDAAARCVYPFRLWRREWRAGVQVAVPMAGVAFSPNYGQSYYELFSLGHFDRNVVFAHLFNMPSLRYRLTLDFPAGRHGSSFRIAYSGQMHQSKFNNLRYHSYTHDFMVGYTKKLYRQ